MCYNWRGWHRKKTGRSINPCRNPRGGRQVEGKPCARHRRNSTSDHSPFLGTYTSLPISGLTKDDVASTSLVVAFSLGLPTV